MKKKEKKDISAIFIEEEEEKEDIGVLIIEEVFQKIKCLDCNLCCTSERREECIFESYEWGRRVARATKNINKRKEVV